MILAKLYIFCKILKRFFAILLLEGFEFFFLPSILYKQFKFNVKLYVNSEW